MLLLTGFLCILFLLYLLLIGWIKPVEHARAYYSVAFTLTSVVLIGCGGYLSVQFVKNPAQDPGDKKARKQFLIHVLTANGITLFFVSLLLALVQSVTFGYSLSEGAVPLLDLTAVVGAGLVGIAILCDVIAKRDIDDDAGATLVTFAFMVAILYVMLLAIGFIHPSEYAREQYERMFVGLVFVMAVLAILVGLFVPASIYKDDRKGATSILYYGLIVKTGSLALLACTLLIALIQYVTFSYGWSEGIFPFLDSAAIVCLLIPLLSHVVLVAFSMFTQGYREKVTPLKIAGAVAYVLLVIAVIMLRAWYS